MKQVKVSFKKKKKKICDFDEKIHFSIKVIFTVFSVVNMVCAPFITQHTWITRHCHRIQKLLQFFFSFHQLTTLTCKEESFCKILNFYKGKNGEIITFVFCQEILTQYYYSKIGLCSEVCLVDKSDFRFFKTTWIVLCVLMCIKTSGHISM